VSNLSPRSDASATYRWSCRTERVHVGVRDLLSEARYDRKGTGCSPGLYLDYAAYGPEHVFRVCLKARNPPRWSAALRDRHAEQDDLASGLSRPRDGRCALRRQAIGEHNRLQPRAREEYSCGTKNDRLASRRSRLFVTPFEAPAPGEVLALAHQTRCARPAHAAIESAAPAVERQGRIPCSARSSRALSNALAVASVCSSCRKIKASASTSPTHGRDRVAVQLAGRHRTRFVAVHDDVPEGADHDTSHLLPGVAE